MVKVKEDRAFGEGAVLSSAPVLVSTVLVLLIVVSGVGYACSGIGGGGDPTPTLDLVVTSLSKVSGPTYASFVVLTPLPMDSAAFKVGPFAPGDSVVVSYTVENTGSIPASLSSSGVAVTPSNSGFVVSKGALPSTLDPGASFSSTITITLPEGLGNSYEGKTAAIVLEIGGTGITTTTTCVTTTTHTTIVWVTTTKTVTMTTTKTTTKYQDFPLDLTDLWVTTSSCTTVTVTSTLTTTFTTTYATYTTLTKTVTTTSCTQHDGCK